MSEDNSNKKFKKFKLDIAPDVDLEDDSPFANLYSEGGTKEIQVNLPYDRMVALPKMEIPNPLLRTNQSKGLNLPSGHVDQQHFNDHTFEQQSRTFKVYGYAQDPSLTTQDNYGNLGRGQDGTGYVGDLEKYKEYGGLTTYDNVPKKVKHMPKPKRQAKGDPSILNGEGAYLGPWASYEEPTKDEDEEQVPLAAPTQTEPKVHKPIDDSLDGKETSIFHGSSEFDYLGRTYMHVPRDLDVNLMGTPGEQKCFLPKSQIHTWEGHEKGVSKLEFFPNSGHLLLSCGMDGLAKLWDVYHDRDLLRSYKGHTKAIRDIKFNNDGTRFLTAGYDRYLKLWDTETGKCLQSINVGKIPYCATFNPNPDRQHLVLAGCSDKKIVQYDLNTGEVVQEYDQHLGGVNSITFVDDNRRFVTTSDDKTLRVWEFDIPVVIKYIAEPYMHSMPAVSKHPSNKWLAAQSLDNQILIFSATDRVKQNNKKSFKGHITSGFACQPNFSPDGKYLISGDASGSLWVWDWQTTKILKKIKAHDNALITCAWHPQETSKIATGSWDGSIKFWD